MLSLRLPVRLKNRLKIAAAEHGAPMQQILRHAIEHELDHLDSNHE